MAKKKAKKKKANGRPRKYSTAKSMQRAVDKYFATEEEVTVCGLTLALGFATRQSLLDYEGYDGNFKAVLKKAKLKLEEHLEKRLLYQKHPVGAIFNLKNNYGWKDQKEQNLNIAGDPDKPLQVLVKCKNG